MLSEFLANGDCVWGHAPAGQAGNALRGQGEIGGFRFPPLFPLTPSPLETSRDTLHPGTGVTTRTNRPAGRVRGLGYGVAARCGVRGIRNASLPDSCFFMNRFAIWGYGVTIGLPPKPAWGFHPQTPSSLRGGFKQLNSHGLSCNNLEFNTRLSCVMVDILWKKLYNNKED